MVQLFDCRLSRLFFSLFVLSLFLISAVGCGKRRPPIPPAVRSAPNILSGYQRGGEIILQLKNPGTAREIKQLNLYRLVEFSDPQVPLSVEDFAVRATAVAAIAPPPGSPPAIEIKDSLSAYTPSLKIRYAVRLTLKDGGRTEFSNFFVLEPSSQVPLPPVSLTAETTAQTVALRWDKSLRNLDGGSPPNLIGYNVYRAETEKSAARLKLNDSPLADNNFNDNTIVFGANYSYLVRAVGVTARGAQIESSDSANANISPRDVFPPGAPQNPTAAAAPGRLSLFFAANPESDLRGYLIYRSTDAKLPPAQWEKLTPAPITETTFQDLRVEPGQLYFYYLIAVDQTGNLSQPSEIVSETAF